MKFTVSKTEIVKALSSTLGVVEKRQALPILSNILLKVEDFFIILNEKVIFPQIRWNIKKP